MLQDIVTVKYCTRLGFFNFLAIIICHVSNTFKCESCCDYLLSINCHLFAKNLVYLVGPRFRHFKILFRNLRKLQLGKVELSNLTVRIFILKNKAGDTLYVSHSLENHQTIHECKLGHGERFNNEQMFPGGCGNCLLLD